MKVYIIMEGERGTGVDVLCVVDSEELAIQELKKIAKDLEYDRKITWKSESCFTTGGDWYNFKEYEVETQ